MRLTQLFSLLALVFVIPGVAAAAYVALSRDAAKVAASFVSSPAGKPCFVAGDAGYRLFAGSTTAAHIVRVDNNAANPTLRMQLVDDAAAAEFVLVDDSDGTNACNNVSSVESIRVDATAAKPDLTVSISRAPAEHKIYLNSKTFSETDAALFAVIWQRTGRAGTLHTATR